MYGVWKDTGEGDLIWDPTRAFLWDGLGEDKGHADLYHWASIIYGLFINELIVFGSTRVGRGQDTRDYTYPQRAVSLMKMNRSSDPVFSTQTSVALLKLRKWDKTRSVPMPSLG